MGDNRLQELIDVSDRSGDGPYFRDVKQLAADLLALLETEPTYCCDDLEDVCAYCDRFVHADDCPWFTARRRWM